MNLNQNSQYLSEEEGEEDIKQTIFKYLYYWPWFAGAMIIAILTAGIYLRYASDIYQTETKIKILEAEEGGIDLSGLMGGADVFGVNEVNLENEIQIITSRRILSQVIDELNLNTYYYNVGQIKSSELWKDDIPFKINWHNISDSLLTSIEEIPVFNIQFSSNSKFNIFTDNSEPSKSFTYGNKITLDGLTFSVVLNPYYKGDLTTFNEDLFAFKYVPTEALLQNFSKILTVQPVGEKSEILELVLTGENAHKNEAILNELVKQFNQDGIEDKRLVSKRTSEFIQKRLVDLTKELDTVETRLVDYKQSSDLITVESTATQLFTKEGTTEAKRFEVQNQLAITQSFKDELVNGKAFSLLPANIGIESESINNLTNSYNEAILSRGKLLISATQENPMVINLEDRLNHIKHNIIQSVHSYIQSLKISLNNLELREARTASKLNTIPKKSKRVRSISRQQAIKEKLYLFLLQKREEAALTYAITSPTIKVVDYSYTLENPVSPKTKIVLLAAIILSLLIPFGVLYVRFLLNTKIENKEQIQKVLGDIPIVAEIPQLDKNSTDLIQPNDRTVLAEAFRILRTNINYFKPKNKEKGEGQIIYVTSTTKGEGKTFTAVNLAVTLASTNKKVILIGSDLRNPQLHRYLNMDKNTQGVSSYLYDDTVQFSDLILKDPLNYGYLDIILSGNIPPNPAELLLNGRYEELLNEAKQTHDYVIIDTAPTILVTDTLLISSLADITVYMTRANVTEQKLLGHIQELHKKEKLNNIGIVINGLDEKGRYGYNYGYGYGYGEDQVVKNWLKFWKH